MQKAGSQPTPSRAELAAANTRLAATLREMEHERVRLLRQRRLHLVLLGLAVSLPVHIAIMIWLASVTVQRDAPGLGDGMVLSLAALPEQPEQDQDDTPLTDLATSALEQVPELRDTAPAPLDPVAAVAELRPGETGSLSVPGGGGEGSGESGLGGGVAGTSFFGVGSRGTRFAYIVDISGSMEANQKFWLAMSELQRSVESLPDFAYFHVVLFSTGSILPSWQEGWNRARRLETARLRRWLADQAPSGGTQPLSAFYEVFSLDVLPDVVYFMTDGQIPAETPAQVRQLNTRGRGVVIHTIAFGDESGREALKAIADDSGGSYRFVSPGRF